MHSILQRVLSATDEVQEVQDEDEAGGQFPWSSASLFSSQESVGGIPTAEAVAVANFLSYCNQWTLVRISLAMAYTWPLSMMTGVAEPILFPILYIVVASVVRVTTMLYDAIAIQFLRETICKRFFGDVYWALTAYCDEKGNSLPLDRIPRQELLDRTLRADAVLKAVGLVHVSAVKEKIEGNKKVYNPARMLKAERILDSMSSRPSIFWVRIFAYFLCKSWKIMFPLTGIPVSEAQIQKIIEAQKKGPVLLLPTHKSHLDYMIMVYVCFTHGIRLPKVVAGDNLNIPIIGPLLRRAGAFYIRRTFTNDTDPLYAAVFQSYLEQLVYAGENIECFIEGGRSRSGKALAPRIGVLRIVLGSAIEKKDIGKVTLVPTSISYDRIVENESHVEELSGSQKKKERLFDAIGNTIFTIIWAVNSMGLYGEVNVTFGQHLNLQTFVEHHREKKDVSQRKTRNMLAYRCGYRVLYEAYKCGEVLLSSMVCTVLLGHYQRGMSEEKLLKEVKWLSEKVVQHGGHVKQFKARDVEIVINTVFEGRKDSAGVLKELLLSAFVSSKKDTDNNNGLVKRHKDLLMVELYSPKERMELSVYRNQIIHYFVEDSIVACVVYKHLKYTDENANAGIPIDELTKDSRFLTRLFKREFIYKPAAERRDGAERGYIVHKIVSRMEKRKILKVVTNSAGNKMVSLNGGINREYLFLASLLWHMIDSYWLAAVSLYSLFNLHEKAIREDKLLARIQTIGERLFFEGQMDLFEAISKETLANALERFSGDDPHFRIKAIQFIHVEGGQSENIKGKRVIKLASDMDEAALDQFCAGLMLYRKSVRAYRSKRYRIHMNKGQFFDSKAIVMAMKF